MSFKPASRREALLEELKARHGYTVNPIVPASLTADLSAGAIAEMVLRAEGLEPEMDREQYADVLRIVQDWLFDAHGRGTESRLPF